MRAAASCAVLLKVRSVQVQFTLEVAKQVCGGLIVKPIMLWLDPFLRHTLADLVVWPNRIVVPLSSDPDFDYSALEMQCASCQKACFCLRCRPYAQDLLWFAPMGRSASDHSNVQH